MSAVLAIDDRITLIRAAFYGPYSTEQWTTKNTGNPETPVRRKVRLHRQSDGVLVSEIWSDSVTGAYQFTGIAAGYYYVVAFDHTGTYNGEVVTDISVP